VRVVNSFLHLAVNLLFVALMLCAMGHSQTQGNLPNVVDGAIDNIIGSIGLGKIAWPENIAINDTLVLCMNTQQAGGPFAMADTLGNTWTCTTPTQTPAPETNGYVNMCYTKSSSAGADTITYSFPGSDGTMVGGRFTGLGVVDGSVATGTFAGNSGGSGGTGTVSTTQTTSVNNAMAISCGGESIAGTGVELAPASGELIAHEATSGGYPVLSIVRTGTKGSQTVTYNTWNGAPAFGGQTTFALQTLAFKPTTNIALADSNLPDAASGVIYEADLHCIGGTAAKTYSLVSGSLPAGLSLAGATGKITGSTTTLGTTSLGFQCTDGIITSATDTLSLTVGATFNTPFVRSYNASSNIVTGAVCGDVIHFLARGDDTHTSSGWPQAVSGVSNNFSDSFGSPVHRMVLPIVGPPQAPIVDIAFGPLTQSGTDVISCTNNQSANCALSVSGLFDVANVQTVSDQGALAESIFQTGTISPSYTSVVPNTLLLTGATTLVGGSVTASLGSPFTPNSTDSDIFAYSLYGSTVIASPGTTTAPYTVSASSFFGEWAALIVPLRPALPIASCPVVTVAGEKQRHISF
jgi:hypothetical protein